MFTRCASCRKILLFKQKFETEEGILCESCKIARDERLKRHVENKEKKAAETIEKKKLNKKLAEQKLRQELAKEQDKSINKPKEKIKKKKLVRKIEMNKPLKKENIRFTKEEIDKHGKLILIEADVKRLIVTEWIDGKKRIVLNKNREVRRTHAGGFSAEKFQKFVDFKKKKAFEWIAENLEKPGVLRPPYDITKVDAEGELKEAIERFIHEM